MSEITESPVPEPEDTPDDETTDSEPIVAREEPTAVMLLGSGELSRELTLAFQRLGGAWAIGASHLVQVPAADSLTDALGFLQPPDFTLLGNPAVYVAALTIAAVASLETLLNLEVTDKLDPRQRSSPPSRELLAQGVGNLASGMIGGLPVTSVIAPTMCRGLPSAPNFTVPRAVHVRYGPPWSDMRYSVS